MKILRKIKDFFKKYEHIIVYTASVLSLICIVAIVYNLVSFMVTNGNSTPIAPTEPPTSLSASNNSTEKNTSENTSTDNSETDTTTKPNSTDEPTTSKEPVTDNEEETTTPDKVTDNKSKYLIKVNTAQNCITIYKRNDDGEYTTPYKAMVCSTGKSGALTPLGTFKLGDIQSFSRIDDGQHVQCAIKFNGNYMFHTVTYTSMTNSSLDTEMYNTLGTSSTSGNIMLSVADMLWIRKNCPTGTLVVIYSDVSNPGPLGKPAAIKIPLDSDNKGFDPTDPDENNPWNDLKPTIKSNNNKVSIQVGSDDKQLLSKFTILDTCGNDASEIAEISGTYNLNELGNYMITITVKDALSRSALLNVEISVVAEEETTTEEVTKETTEADTTEATTEETTTVDETTEKVTTEKTTTEKTTPEKTTVEKPSKEDNSEKETTTKKQPISEKETTTKKKPVSEKETTTKKKPVSEKETTSKKQPTTEQETTSASDSE